MSKKKFRNIHLTKKSDIRRLLSSTINCFRQGKIDRESARATGYLCGQLLAVMESMQRDDLEKRLAKLEEAIEERGQNR